MPKPKKSWKSFDPSKNVNEGARQTSEPERCEVEELSQGDPMDVQEPTPKRSKSLDDEEMAAATEAAAEALSPASAELLQHSLPNHPASTDGHTDRRIQSAAATLAGTAGMLLAGPVSGMALGAGALYASTREDMTGTVARKAGSMYLQVADRAIDEGVRVVDQGIKKLGEAVDQMATSSSLPDPVKAGLRRLGGDSSASRSNPTADADEARKLLQKYPDRVPVFCYRSTHANLPDLPKRKFAVPRTWTCSEFKYLIHRQLVEALRGGTSVDQTIYIFVNGITPKTSSVMSEMYDQFKGDDGFLHVKYSAENTLG
eukprot:TRINITY_DN102077_c0_g1_i1.p1 TRINITY_DN102077_c0_g1~~TRINITY_DN102077_c0_g1_i1.p1  ORF type:complete len:315 (-),score=47.45 TRINITY_DN102077_c0_g1_i1:239-1183(-)